MFSAASISLMICVLLLVVLFALPAFPQNVYSGQRWDRLFSQSWIAQSNGEFSKARDFTAEGWKLVSAAGPSAFGYADGVEQAYATTVSVSGPLPASRFYSEALKATASNNLILVRLQILIRQAFRYSHNQEVASNSAYEEALALVEPMRLPPGYFAQMLRDFADLKERMGDSGGAERLRSRATSAPSNVPIPYPRFGMQDITTEPIAGYNPAVKTLVEEATRLLREGEFERAGVAADQAFALIETLPYRQRYWEDDHFETIASGYSVRGRKSEATAVLEREIAASQRLWGVDHPAFARTLEKVAWRYINDLQALGPAHELIERAARIISASDGQASDAMSFIDDTRLRLAQLEGNSDAAAELKAKIREIWVTVHGANTKPLVIP